MGIQIIGNSGVINEIEANTRAQRVTIRPIDVGALGSYRLAAFSGLTTALAADGVVFALRWPDATRFALIKYLRVRAQVVVGFTAAQELGFDAIMARSYTVAESVGTVVVMTTNNNKKRTSMGSSLIGSTGDIRVAAAAVVSGGTRTLDANPIMYQSGQALAAAATVAQATMEASIDLTNSGDYPFVLAQNEGFLVRNKILMGAAGTIRWSVEVAWDEVASY